MYDAITDEMETDGETARIRIVMEPTDKDVRTHMQMERGSAPLIIEEKKDRRKGPWTDFTAGLRIMETDERRS